MALTPWQPLPGSNQYELRGVGSPYGVVTPASTGIYYTDTVSTNGAVRWVSTGTANTSWKVAYGDTGWRAITTSDSSGVVTGTPYPSGVTPQSGLAGGFIIRRCAESMEWQLWGITLATGSTITFTFPTGFTAGVYGAGSSYSVTAYGSSATITVRQLAGYILLNVSTLVSLGTYGIGNTISPSGIWPTVLPGTPA